MKVVLDTNIIFGDFHLKGAKIKNLCESTKSIGGTVYIPELVIDESINKYKEQLQLGNSKIDKGISDLKRLIGKTVFDNPITDEYIIKEVEEYQKEFRKQIKKLGINIIPYPTIKHKELVKRDLARKKPFQESGKGYRDALIWENVKSLCEKSPELFDIPKIVFINKNYKDFCEKDFSLHPDLKEDLVNNGLQEGSVRIVEEIDIFVNDYIKPQQKILKSILTKLNKNKRYNDIDLNSEIEDRVIKYLSHREFDYEESPFRQEFENPSVVSVDEPSYTVTDVRQISEDEILIEIDVDVDCEFDFFIFKSDAMCMDEDELPYIWNNDWNKHYMAASKTIPVKLKMSLIVDTAFNEILSDDIEIVHPEIDYHDRF
ncbi:putative nucleic acid-binding protein [Dysgonomonas hofstadii]|uniref:Putative nucleic acid-binding protein n=1 Tax=Dysgonomonas hofstadii TaxID=637886 RepID=A0A840CXE8_9BACT|nr:PIN domain-containing protein [Dysgonomonas hofstadii]MBB4038234.1 putative nucleic acid-binding protein [Dysgonomonas hofstadii]